MTSSQSKGWGATGRQYFGSGALVGLRGVVDQRIAGHGSCDVCADSRTAGRKSPPATENLLEDTDGLRRLPLRRAIEGRRSNPSVPSRRGSLLRSIVADARSSDDVIAF